MSIFINGLKVRSSELNEDFEVQFKDLNEKGQRRLFTENKTLFLYDALTSEYESIQALPLQFKDEYSSETLNSIIKKVLSKMLLSKECDLILEFLNIPGFELDEDLRKDLSFSQFYPIKCWVAKSEKTSTEILKSMFLHDVCYSVWSNWYVLLDLIISNPNFRFDLCLDNHISTRFNEADYYALVERIKLLSPHHCENN